MAAETRKGFAESRRRRVLSGKAQRDWCSLVPTNSQNGPTGLLSMSRSHTEEKLLGAKSKLNRTRKTDKETKKYRESGRGE